MTLQLVQLLETDSSFASLNDPSFLQRLLRFLGFENDFTSRLYLDHSQVSSISFAESLEPKKVLIIRFNNFLKEVVRQPITILQALAQIGGLLVFLRISVFMRLLHQILFERKLQKELSSPKEHE